MKDALKKVFSEELVLFKKTEESSKEMLIRRKMLIFIMEYIQSNFVLDNIPETASEAKSKLKKISFSKDAALESLDELEGLMNRLY